MGGMSLWHLIILAVIILVLFGPSRLPHMGKSIGEAIRGFKKGLSEDPEIDVTESTRREQIREPGTNQTQTAENKERSKV